MTPMNFTESDYHLGARKCHYAFLQRDESLPPIVFLHGITTFGHYFDEVVKHLRVNNSIYLMDFRGHGLSDPGEGLYTINSYREDIHYFLQIINRPVHVVGHSLGGRVGISLTATYPEQVVSLAILDVAPTVDQRGFARLYYGITNMPRPFKNREHVFEFYRTTWGGAKDFFIELMLRYGMIANTDGTITPRFDPLIFSLPPEVLVAEMNELWACCRKIRVPVIVVRGECSDVLNEQIAQQLQQAIAGSRYFEIKGAKHSLGADAPKEVAEILNDFLIERRSAML